MSDKKKEDGYTDVDEIDYDPEFHEMEEDHAMEEMKKTNPKLYALMKKAGAEVDEEEEIANEGSTQEN